MKKTAECIPVLGQVFLTNRHNKIFYGTLGGMEEDDNRTGERRKRKERNEDSRAVGPPVKK